MLSSPVEGISKEMILNKVVFYRSSGLSYGTLFVLSESQGVFCSCPRSETGEAMSNQGSLDRLNVSWRMFIAECGRCYFLAQC